MGQTASPPERSEQQPTSGTKGRGLRRRAAEPSCNPRHSAEDTHAAAPCSSSVGSGTSRPTWTFSSSGWLFVYHFGVIKSLKRMNLHREVYTIATSGGSCAGAFLQMENDPDDVVKFVIECSKTARSTWTGLFRLKEYLKGAIAQFSSEELPGKLRGNYEISVTSLPWLRNERVKDWASMAEGEASILASSCAIPFAGLPVYVPGVGYCIDGGVSDFQLIRALLLGSSYFTYHDDASVTVCPFYCSRADIRPSEYVPVWWAFFPPSPEDLWRVYELGQRDAMAWVVENKGKNNLAACPIPEVPLEEEVSMMQEGLQMIESELEEMGQEISAMTVEAMSGVCTMWRHVLQSLGWTLVYWELAVQTFVSAVAASLAPLLPKSLKAGGSTFKAWKRCGALSQQITSPKVLLKTVPAIGTHIRMNMETLEALFHLSFFFRFLWFLKEQQA
eukprot:CAMPEP_0177774544 /NCGR_PEP_ID=MMETSP0491_2-20121128/13567_1 /TAXON_ID=63592 /ORGANISM="Tetraselmis chuii, Strain PLY429" /LENGTH=445 /DNA_ID=CAMNT_0019292937 /DNA_START=111 /DNA_END=1448 /DNA_ORIENTATION=+